MKICLVLLLIFAATLAMKKESHLKSSQITKLRAAYKLEFDKAENVPKERKLSLKRVSETPVLQMKSTYGPRQVDRYLKPILPRSLENSEEELDNDLAPKILKIEEINENTGEVERVLHSSFEKTKTRKVNK